MKLILSLVLLTQLGWAADLKQIHQSVQKNESILIDVREKEEVDLGMIKGAKWVPLSKTDLSTLKKIKKDYNKKTLYVYCRSGTRAEKFITLLKSVGLKAENLGGYEELKEKGLPVTQ